MSSITPYLFFGGRCQEALDFYTRTIGAKVLFQMLHNQSPDAHPPGMLQPGFETKIMHASFLIGDSVIMASDGCEEGQAYAGFCLALSAPDAEEAQKRFNALSEGGQVKMPMMKTFWSPMFGMLTDKFGIEWMVSVPDPSQKA